MEDKHTTVNEPIDQTIVGSTDDASDHSVETPSPSIKQRKMLIGLFIGILLIVFIILSSNSEPVAYTKTYYQYFDTQVVVRAWLTNQDPDDIFSDIETILEEGHQVATRYEAYDGVHNVYYINTHPNEVIDIDPVLTEMIALSIDIHENTSPLFNIALGRVFDVWTDYREQCLDATINECKVPPLYELMAASVGGNPSLIELDETNHTIKIPDKMTLDLGAVAKGYMADKVGEYLRDQNVEVFMINAGTSNIEFEGTNPNPDRDYWSVGLKDPDNPQASYGRIQLTSGYSAVTSGDYARYYTVDGKQYHHIITPETLFPAYYTRTVTIISKNPFLADIYSTVAFLMPIDEAIIFINSLDDTEAIWLDYDRQIHYSNGFEADYLLEIFIED